MTELTEQGRQARERVLEHVPGARIQRWNHETVYVARPCDWSRFLDYSPIYRLSSGPDESSAWISADENTKEDR